MKLTAIWAKCLLASSLALALSSFAWTAQESQEKSKTGKAMTVTGCLQKGDEANEYSITSQDGKRYGLYADQGVDLSKHLGHKVSITGTKTKGEHTHKEKNEAGVAETADLRVTNLQLISETCQ